MAKTAKITNLHERPNCINHGCDTPSTWSIRLKDGSVRWRVFCGSCLAAESGSKLKEGVTQYRTGVCSNKNARLGFKCPTKHSLIPPGIKLTEIDHIDGNRNNNDHSNVQELCAHCHKIKGMFSGDYNRWKKVA